MLKFNEEMVKISIEFIVFFDNMMMVPSLRMCEEMIPDMKKKSVEIAEHIYSLFEISGQKLKGVLNPKVLKRLYD